MAGVPRRSKSTMSYLVLARKYRPRTFTEIAGQEVSTNVLKGAIEEQRVGHAYLFSGPRGTGKTTTARIFAKALNCEQGPTATPCGTCERCVAADSGSDVDIVEIDAASNTGVDSVRALRDQAAYMPLKARFKVYIIDEVHMLSKPAFNALLKTLEEPPPHVKFLFATTEQHKVLDTILSRCQVLRLSPISERVIAERLREVFGLEGVEPGEGVVEEIARLARGGLRDALSIADQLLALVGSKPQLADLDRMSSEGSSSGMSALVDALVAGDRAGVLALLPATEGGESEHLEGLLDHLRAALVAAVCGEDSPLLSTTRANGLAARAKEIGARRLELWLTELVHARERMRLLPGQSRLILELTLLDLCREEHTLPIEELVARLEALEARLSGGAAPAPSIADAIPRPAPDSSSPRAAAPRPAPAPPRSAPEPEPAAAPRRRTGAEKSSSTDAWKGFLEALADASPSLHAVFENRGKLVEFGADRALVQLSKLREDERLLIEDRRNRTRCAKLFSSVVGRDIDLAIDDMSGAKRGEKDPYTKHVADLFGGRIEDET